MTGLIIKNQKYVMIYEDRSKHMLLEDKVYYVLQDIFWNGDCVECIRAHHFSNLLTTNISSDNKYSNALNELEYTQQLYNWLKRLIKFKDHLFEFEIFNDVNINMNKYMNYDEWWNEFLELISKLEGQIQLLK